MATGNMYRRFHELWTRGFPRYVSGHTDRYTDTLITILHTPTGGKVTARADDELLKIQLIN